MYGQNCLGKPIAHLSSDAADNAEVDERDDAYVIALPQVVSRIPGADLEGRRVRAESGT